MQLWSNLRGVADHRRGGNDRLGDRAGAVGDGESSGLHLLLDINLKPCFIPCSRAKNRRDQMMQRALQVSPPGQRLREVHAVAAASS